MFIWEREVKGEKGEKEVEGEMSLHKLKVKVQSQSPFTHSRFSVAESTSLNSALYTKNSSFPNPPPPRGFFF